jgi:hypothetical protein
MSDPAPPPDQPASPRSPSSTGWIVAFVVVAVLLAVAVAYIVLRDDDGDDEAATQGSPSTTATTSTTAATTTEPSAEDGSDGPGDEGDAPVEAECSADALLAAVDPDVAPEDQGVADYACTPASAGDLAGGYAWAKLVAPGVDPADAFFVVTTDGATGDVGWQMLDYGTAVFCEDSMPAEACDLLPGAPRQ